MLTPSTILGEDRTFEKLDYLRNKILESKKENNVDSIKIYTEEISLVWKSMSKEEVFDYEIYNLLKSENVEKQLEVSKTKSQMQSLLLLLICLTAFVYLIYYTDKKNRESQNKKIQAASGISEYEASLRKRISEKLHDDLGGSIAALKMKWVSKKELSDDVKILDDLYQDVRKFSKDLNFQNKFHLKSIEEAIHILSNEMCANFRKKTINIFPKEINNINDSIFAFASDLKALWSIPEIQKEIEYDAFSDYLKYGYIHAPKSIHKNIYQLLPGHLIEITSEDGFSTRNIPKPISWWDFKKIINN